jgi:hypothetical protein
VDGTGSGLCPMMGFGISIVGLCHKKISSGYKIR